MGLWYQSQFHLWGPIKGHLGSYQNTWSEWHIHLLTEFHGASPVSTDIRESKSENTKSLSATGIIRSRHRQFLEACPEAPMPIQLKSLDQWEARRGRADQSEESEGCVVPGILLTHSALLRSGPCWWRTMQCWWGGSICFFLTFRYASTSLQLGF